MINPGERILVIPVEPGNRLIRYGRQARPFDYLKEITVSSDGVLFHSSRLKPGDSHKAGPASKKEREKTQAALYSDAKP